MKRQTLGGGQQPCKPQWVFTLKDGMKAVVFNRRADGTYAASYAVRRGDVFYDGRGGMGRMPAYKDERATRCIQVTAAMPGIAGELCFTLYRIDETRRHPYVKIGSYTRTQKAFVRILRDGIKEKEESDE